jgi:hypothetical protein
MAGLLDLLPKDSVFRQAPTGLNQVGQQLLDSGVGPQLAKFFSEHYDIKDVPGIADHLKRLNGSKAADYPQLYFSSHGGLLTTGVPGLKPEFEKGVNSQLKSGDINNYVKGLTVTGHGLSPFDAQPGVYLQPTGSVDETTADLLLPHEMSHWSRRDNANAQVNLPFERALPSHERRMVGQGDHMKIDLNRPVSRYFSLLGEGVPSSHEMLADLAAINTRLPPGKELSDVPIYNDVVSGHLGSEDDMATFYREGYKDVPQMRKLQPALYSQAWFEDQVEKGNMSQADIEDSFLEKMLTKMGILNPLPKY